MWGKAQYIYRWRETPFTYPKYNGPDFLTALPHELLITIDQEMDIYARIMLRSICKHIALPSLIPTINEFDTAVKFIHMRCPWSGNCKECGLYCCDGSHRSTCRDMVAYCKEYECYLHWAGIQGWFQPNELTRLPAEFVAEGTRRFFPDFGARFRFSPIIDAFRDDETVLDECSAGILAQYFDAAWIPGCTSFAGSLVLENHTVLETFDRFPPPGEVFDYAVKHHPKWRDLPWDLVSCTLRKDGNGRCWHGGSCRLIGDVIGEFPRGGSIDTKNLIGESVGVST